MRVEMKKPLGMILALALAVFPAALAAGEIVTGHLVFEKSVKMKKLDATLYVPFEEGEGMSCGVIARGKNGRLPASGSFRLRLVGEQVDGSSPWEGRTVSAAIDDTGHAVFAGEEIAELASEAGAQGAEVALHRVELVGGRGGRVTELTLDCFRDGEES